MTNRLRDCLRCRRQRVPCDQQKPACQLCVALHVFDECHYPEDNSVSNQLSPHLVDYALTSRTDVLTQVMAASETPLLDDMLPNNDWSIQDPELIPTTNDWILVYSFFTANERSGQIRMSIDVRNFINNFYHEPPALRLTLCAIAAHYSKSPLPESVSLSYYQRARKALFRAADHPSVKTAQAFYWIFCFAYWKGQPEIGRPFFKAALGMILGLKLNIDPDDSSWLLPLNLTASEKEERRRLFWGCYYILKVEQSMSGETLPIHISTSKVKPPGPVTEPYPSFASFDSYASVCAVHDLIVAIRQHHAQPPLQIQHILSSESGSQLNDLFLQTYSKIPLRYLLLAEHAETLTPLDYDRFIQQLLAIPRHEFRFTIGMNLNLLTATSILNRPKMYLSGIKSLSSTPEALTTEARYIISTAISQSLESAHRIACFLVFLTTVTEGQEYKTRIQSDLFEWYTYILHPLFEAMIVFWFVQCRMDPIWWASIERGTCSRDVLQERLKLMVQVARKVGGIQKGMGEPIVQCMEAMLKEVDDMGRWNPVIRGQNGDAGTVDDIVLGMKVVALGDNGLGGEDEVQEVPLVTKEPWAFMGLLGMEVGGGIRWRGRYELDWRRFWIQFK